jgi:hypothetical protein
MFTTSPVTKPAPAAGAVIATFGAGLFCTLITTIEDVVVAPSLSVATAVKLNVPIVAAV